DQSRVWPATQRVKKGAHHISHEDRVRVEDQEEVSVALHGENVVSPPESDIGRTSNQSHIWKVRLDDVRTPIGGGIVQYDDPQVNQRGVRTMSAYRAQTGSNR